MNKLMQTEKVIEKAVVDGYKAIETGVISGYQKLEDTVVGGYQHIEKKFVDAFLTPNAEQEQEHSSQQEKE